MVTIASYNIRKAIGGDRRRRPERILQVMESIGADVFVLQEADRRFGSRQSAIPSTLLTAESHYRPVPYEVRPGGIGWHGNAILVRPHVEILRRQILTLPMLEPRGAVLADLQAGDRRFRVVGMHLDISGLWRRRQIRSILKQLDEQEEQLPLFMVGDCNEWRRSGGFLSELEGFESAPCPPSYPARMPIARLDRIIASPEIRFTACGTEAGSLARIASDHLPIWASAEVPAYEKEPAKPDAGVRAS